jgi:hypothetical protein
MTLLKVIKTDTPLLAQKSVTQNSNMVFWDSLFRVAQECDLGSFCGDSAEKSLISAANLRKQAAFKRNR